MEMANELLTVALDEFRNGMKESNHSVWVPDLMGHYDCEHIRDWEHWEPFTINVCLVCYTPAPFNIKRKQIKTEYCPTCGKKMRNPE